MLTRAPAGRSGRITGQPEQPEQRAVRPAVSYSPIPAGHRSTGYDARGWCSGLGARLTVRA
ncbi:hypothetical protein [Kitasatospora indigofera]|uniref:hypothetical protein n=1 Tax=Kitasatospora indigofera TaxID=67307 RepID=UPI0033B0C00C